MSGVMDEGQALGRPRSRHPGAPWAGCDPGTLTPHPQTLVSTPFGGYRRFFLDPNVVTPRAYPPKIGYRLVTPRVYPPKIGYRCFSWVSTNCSDPARLSTKHVQTMRSVDALPTTSPQEVPDKFPASSLPCLPCPNTLSPKYPPHPSHGKQHSHPIRYANGPLHP